jgi:hypothetical protein
MAITRSLLMQFYFMAIPDESVHTNIKFKDIFRIDRDHNARNNFLCDKIINILILLSLNLRPSSFEKLNSVLAEVRHKCESLNCIILTA